MNKWHPSPRPEKNQMCINAYKNWKIRLKRSLINWFFLKVNAVLQQVFIAYIYLGLLGKF